ncbi:MAG: outer membrane beta-barrel protein [Bacteroidota bacterium]
MKRYAKIFFPLMMVFAFANLANAQAPAKEGELKLHLNYNYAIPLGSFKNELISNGSARGFSGDLLYQINPKWAAGISAGYQDFVQKYPRAVYETGSHESTSAVLTNSVEISPLMAKGIFTPMGGNGKTLQPFISAGAGVNMLSFRQYLGEFGGADNQATFIAQAGAGLNLAFGKTKESGFSIGADYNYVPYQRNGFGNMNSLGLHAGLYFPLK